MHYQMNRMMWQMAEHRRITGMGERRGYVHEVKEKDGQRKVRVVMGIKKNGQPWLSPWVHSEEHRGGSRHQALMEKGQNVVVTTHGGDFRNSTLTSSEEGSSFPQPGHASSVNGDTRQIGKVRHSDNKPSSNGGGGGGGGSGSSDHFSESWIAEQDDNPPQHQEQSGQQQGKGGGGDQGGQQQGGQQQQAKAAMKSRVHEQNGITHRVGDNMRLFVSKKEKEVMISYGSSLENTVFCNETGCFSSKPIQIKKPQSKADND